MAEGAGAASVAPGVNGRGGAGVRAEGVLVLMAEGAGVMTVNTDVSESV